MVNTVINGLSFLTLVSNFLFAILFLLFLHSKVSKKSHWKKISNYFKKRATALSLFFAITASTGSLFLSEIARYTPCLFCWYQRIFMYPLVIILAVALIKKTKDVASYVFPTAVIGALIAGFHYWGQITYNPFASCASLGFSISCSERFFTHYGYITIPFMSLSSFVYIASLMYLLKSK